MRFRQLPLWCRECGGQAPARIRQVGLTPHHQLVIHFLCLGCKRHVYVVKDLAECWRECPKPEEDLEVVDSGPELMREPDLNFLHSLGVILPDDDPM